MKKNILPNKTQALKLAEDYGFQQVRVLMNHEHPNCDDKAYTYFYDGFMACLKICKKSIKDLRTKEEVTAKIYDVLLATGKTIRAITIIKGGGTGRIEFNADDLNQWIEQNL